jgi:hypothetical protein
MILAIKSKVHDPHPRSLGRSIIIFFDVNLFFAKPFGMAIIERYIGAFTMAIKRWAMDTCHLVSENICLAKLISTFFIISATPMNPPVNALNKSEFFASSFYRLSRMYCRVLKETGSYPSILLQKLG